MVNTPKLVLSWREAQDIPKLRKDEFPDLIMYRIFSI